MGFNEICEVESGVECVSAEENVVLTVFLILAGYFVVGCCYLRNCFALVPV